MSLWVFQGPNYNNYIIYITGTDNTQYGVMKSGPLGEPIYWSYTENTGQIIQRVVGAADASGTVFVAYQRADSRIVVASISADGGTRLWSVSYLPDTVIGTFTQPALTVVGDVLVLSCIGGTSNQVQVLKLNKFDGTTIWTRQLENGTAVLSPVSTIGDGSVTTVYMTGPSSGVVTQIDATSATGTVSWTRSFPEETPPMPPCFLAGTPVRMADGSWQEIQTLKAGDRLWTVKGPRNMVELIQREVKPFVAHFPYFFPEGFLGARCAFAISPAHKIILKSGKSVYPAQLGLKKIPMTAPWIYYNIRMPRREHVCVAGVTVESCPPVIRKIVSGYQLQQLVMETGLAIKASYAATLLRGCKLLSRDGTVVEVPLLEKELLQR